MELCLRRLAIFSSINLYPSRRPCRNLYCSISRTPPPKMMSSVCFLSKRSSCNTFSVNSNMELPQERRQYRPYPKATYLLCMFFCTKTLKLCNFYFFKCIFTVNKSRTRITNCFTWNFFRFISLLLRHFYQIWFSIGHFYFP
jgi:hypothetical protein